MDENILVKVSGVVSESIVDGPGMRYTIFTQGCPHNCEGCHNPETHDFNGGRYMSIDELYNALSTNELLSGVTFSGGEPLCQASVLLKLARRIKTNTDLNIVIFTGYLIENLRAAADPNIIELLDICDWLIDGKFELAYKDLTQAFRGSNNQRIIELPNNTIEWTQ